MFNVKISEKSVRFMGNYEVQNVTASVSRICDMLLQTQFRQDIFQLFCFGVRDFVKVTVEIISLHDNLYILGYYNLHLDNSNGNTKKFNEILTCFDLKQHVNCPTHVHGHWLNLLITKRISNSSKSVFSAAGIWDHLAVISEIGCCKTK